MSINSNKKNIFGVVKWNYEDLRMLRPDWTDNECKQFVDKHENIFRQRQIEEGWEILKVLMEENNN